MAIENRQYIPYTFTERSVPDIIGLVSELFLNWPSSKNYPEISK